MRFVSVFATLFISSCAPIQEGR